MSLENQSPYIIKTLEEEAGQRLDKFLSVKLPEFSRSRIQALMEDGNLLKSGKIFSDSSYKIKAGDEFALNVPAAKPSDILPKNIPLNIIYEDKSLLVIDKQAGLTVHPGAGNHDDTMVNALLSLLPAEKLSGIGGVQRPGIVHRLDKDTSGLMVVAKDDAAHKSLAKQIESRELKRVYLGIIWGAVIPPNGKIEANIGRSKMNRKKMAIFRSGGKKAITHYKTLQNFGGLFSELECRLETGRTHQIRIHLANRGHSIVGDKTYGNSKKKSLLLLPDETRSFIENFPRQALHSKEISFQHPKTGKILHFEAKIPEDIQGLIQRLKHLQN